MCLFTFKNTCAIICIYTLFKYPTKYPMRRCCLFYETNQGRVIIAHKSQRTTNSYKGEARKHDFSCSTLGAARETHI